MTSDAEFSVASVYAELLSRAPENKMEPRMAPLFRAMELLGEPNKAYPVIHITGTNGKTSTARMIESLLQAYGLRTGRYTSPHLVSVTERIVLDGEPVSDETFVRIWDEIRPLLVMVDDELVAAGENKLTYFECVTILALAIFADEPVDVAVIEVGLGGITDATNVVDSQVQVVTPIALDHTDLLGDTTYDIALEKAGIIKPEGFLISAAQPVDAAQVLLDAAKENNARFAFEPVDFGVAERTLAVGGQALTIRGLAAHYEDVLVPLFGEHQAQNAAVAVAAVEAFFGGEKPLEQELVETAFARVRSPGRLEAIRTAPTIILDAGHNPAGVSASAKALKESFGFERIVLVVGILAEKDAGEILRVLHDEYGELTEDICLTQSNSPRAIPAGELGEMALDAGFAEEDLYLTERMDDALEWAVSRAEDPDTVGGGLGSGILVTGSITVIGEARMLLEQTEGK